MFKNKFHVQKEVSMEMLSYFLGGGWGGGGGVEWSLFLHQ